MEQYADVIIDLSVKNVDRVFQYRIPDHLRDLVKPGVQVNIPFGKGNTKPLFAQKNLRVLKVGIYGKTQNTVKLQLRDPSGAVMDGLYWGEAKEFADFARSHETISVTYYPRINSYMGRESLQIVIQNYC